MTSAPVRNEGSVLLAQTGKTAEEIGARIGCARSLAGHWLSGRRKPTKPRRAKLKAEFKIPIPSWDRAVKPGKAPEPARVTSTDAELAARTTEDAYAQLHITALRQIEESNDPNTPAGERSRLARNAAHTLAIVDRFRRSSLSEAAIIKMPAWTRIWTEILKALEAHPDVALDIDKRLAALSDE